MSEISLQRQLIKNTLLSSVIVGIGLMLVVLGTSFWQNTKWQDEIMQESAELVLRVDFANKDERRRLDELQGVMQEFQLHYQLSLDEWVLNDYELHDVFQQQDFKPEAKPGLSHYWHEGQLWRVYYAEHNELKVFMVQPWQARTELLYKPFMYGLLLCFISWCALGLMNYLFIQRALKPVQILREQIQQRSIEDLSPVSLAAWVEIQPVVSALNTLLARLEAAIASEQRFTADASHELRTPLSGLNMRIQLLMRKYSDDNVITNELQKMLNDLQRSRTMIENLLLLAKLDPKSVNELNPIQIPLSQLCERISQDFTPFMTDKNLSIRIDISKQVFIQADEILMSIALKNLLENAIKYAQNDSEIWVKLSESCIPVLIIGNYTSAIKKEHLDHLTERFYRIKDQSEHVQQTGSGLGLSIVSKILDLHKISYSFQYSEDQHSFEVQLTHLPLVESENRTMLS